jgi:hypothetical protein
LCQAEHLGFSQIKSCFLLFNVFPLIIIEVWQWLQVGVVICSPHEATLKDTLYNKREQGIKPLSLHLLRNLRQILASSFSYRAGLLIFRFIVFVSGATATFNLTFA